MAGSQPLQKIEAAFGCGTGKPGKKVIADMRDLAILALRAGACIVYRQMARTGHSARQ
jgi:hypothetical protein